MGTNQIFTLQFKYKHLRASEHYHMFRPDSSSLLSFHYWYLMQIKNNILTPTRISFNVKIDTMYHFKYYH